MNCLDCQQRLQQFLDGEPLPDWGGYEGHLAACSQCRERHAAAQLLKQVLGLGRIGNPSHVYTSYEWAWMRERLVARVLADGRQRLAIRGRVFSGAAMAAAILLALFLSNYPFQRTQFRPPSVALVRPVPAAPLSVNQKVGEAGQ